MHRVFLLFFCFSLIFLQDLSGAPGFCCQHNSCKLDSSHEEPLEDFFIQELLQFEEYTILGNKLYFPIASITLSKEGMVIQFPTRAITVNHLSMDSLGYFIEIKKTESINGTCRNGHDIWHYKCWGCGVLWCPFRCQCYGETFPFTP